MALQTAGGASRGTTTTTKKDQGDQRVQSISERLSNNIMAGASKPLVVQPVGGASGGINRTVTIKTPTQGGSILPASHFEKSQPDPTPRGGVGGTTASAPNYSGLLNYLKSNPSSVSSPYSDKDKANAQKQIDDYIKKLKGELETGQKNANKLAKDMWTQSVAEYKNNLADANNASNRQYKLAEKRMNNLYGENTTGTGLSQLAMNTGNWANAITANRRAYTDARNQAQNQYNQTVNNNNDYYRQQWANTYFPYLTNEVNNIRNYDNQLRMYEMQAQQNRLMNQDDLAYRLQLAQMGLL